MTTTAMTNSDAILTVEHVSMIFGGLVAVNDLSFKARRGEITALIGPNGAGKTTVFNCITGFYKPTSGMMKMTRRNGEEFLLERLPDFEVNRRAKVARTFQNIRLFNNLSVIDNIRIARHTRVKYSFFDGIFKTKKYKEEEAEITEESMKLFERGQALAAQCSTLLEAAQLKVQKLAGESLVAFEEESE